MVQGLDSTCFFTAGYGRHRKLGVGFHAAGYSRHRSQWVKEFDLKCCVLFVLYEVQLDEVKTLIIPYSL